MMSRHCERSEAIQRVVRRLDCFVAALLAMTASLVAARQAQDANTLKKDMIGQWELSTTERSKTCVVTLKGDGPAQGLKLELEPGCAAALPFTKDIAAWSIKGLGDIVRLQDAAGQPVIDFTEVESGIFEGLRTGEGIYILQNLAAARSLAKSMDQMIGDWSMVRGNGQTICGLTLDQHRSHGRTISRYFSSRNAIPQSPHSRRRNGGWSAARCC